MPKNDDKPNEQLVEPLALPAPADTMDVVVPAGRTLHGATFIETSRGLLTKPTWHPPGSVVTLDREEAERLIELGHASRPGEAAPLPQAVQMVSEQGPVGSPAAPSGRPGAEVP